MNPKELLQRCLDNTAPAHRPEELGMLWFGRRFFPDVFDSPFARVHGNITHEICRLYDPRLKRRTERMAAIMVHRESGKTTLDSFLFPLYQIYLKGHRMWIRVPKEGWEGSDTHDYDIVQTNPLNERFILICSETADRAEQFVTNIKGVIEENKELRQYFGDLHGDAIYLDEDESRKRDNMWRKNAFVTGNDVVVVGKGAGQRVRGINIRNRRPSTILVDDMYSGITVKTEVTRQKLEYWFKAEVQNSSDSVHGKTIAVGTLVHEDTVFTKMEKSEMWRMVNLPIIGLEELTTVIEKHCKVSADVLEIPSKQVCAEVQETLETLSWPERHTLHYILQLYKEAFDDGNLNYFYQEYLNIPRAPQNMKFKIDQFRQVEFTWVEHANGRYLEWVIDGMRWRGRPVLNVGMDVASSESKTADDTAIVTSGWIWGECMIPGTDQSMWKAFPMISNIDGGRGWGTYETGMRPGKATRFLREMMQPEVISGTIEVNGGQIDLYRNVVEAAQSEGIFKPIADYTSQTKKVDRILSILEPLVDKHHPVLVATNCWPAFMKMFFQLQTLGPDDMKDDYPDAWALSVVNKLKPAQPVMSLWSGLQVRNKPVEYLRPNSKSTRDLLDSWISA